MTNIAGKWIFWQVIVPIFGPILISVVVAGLWWTAHQNFEIKWHLFIEDLTPWALTFYAITLIGSTVNDLWPKLSQHPYLGWGLILTALFIALYAAIIVISRHDPQFVPGTAVYVVTFILLGISIYLCHEGAKVA